MVDGQAPTALQPHPARIAEAAKLIDPVFRDTPQFEHDALNDVLGCRCLCKVETLNPIRSFKGRGADYLMHQLAGTAERVVCASAGNFGQGLAYAARKREVQLTVFAAESANPLKLEHMRRLGAEVKCQGRDFDEAKEAARLYAQASGATFVEDGREVAVTEGAGTIGLELTRSATPLDAVLVPLGNGALANGIGTYLKAERPSIRVMAIAAAGAPAMAHSWQQRTLVTTERADTIADGIAVRVPVPEALELMKRTVDEVLLVSDEMLVVAMRLARDTLGIMLEPAGAAGLAAALAFKERFYAQHLAIPLCGSNLTEEQIARWLC